MNKLDSASKAELDGIIKEIEALNEKYRMKKMLLVQNIKHLMLNKTLPQRYLKLQQAKELQ
jgi:hypothetical protein